MILKEIPKVIWKETKIEIQCEELQTKDIENRFKKYAERLFKEISILKVSKGEYLFLDEDKSELRKGLITARTLNDEEKCIYGNPWRIYEVLPFNSKYKLSKRSVYFTTCDTYHIPKDGVCLTKKILSEEEYKANIYKIEADTIYNIYLGHTIVEWVILEKEDKAVISNILVYA